MSSVDASSPIYTIGHSTRPIDEFIELLKKHGIVNLVDVRSIPRSRHNPQYEQTALKESLPAAGISYQQIKKLGGLRNKDPHSTNTAWRNASFRNYADYMQHDEFDEGLNELLDVAATGPTAIMCAEAVPWRCHRSLIADALTARGIKVLDIISDAKPGMHSMTSFAQVDGHTVTYPGDDTKTDSSV